MVKRLPGCSLASRTAGWTRRLKDVARRDKNAQSLRKQKSGRVSILTAQCFSALSAEAAAAELAPRLFLLCCCCRETVQTRFKGEKKTLIAYCKPGMPAAYVLFCKVLRGISETLYSGQLTVSNSAHAPSPPTQNI